VTAKRLKRRAHRPEPKDVERLSLAPLTFEEALKGALATKPRKDADQEPETEGDGDDA
jgi:hypothetical protein